MFFIIDNPGDLGGVESILIDQYATRPHACCDRISADPHLSALQVLRMFDPGIRTDQQPAVVEATRNENWQRDERGTIGTGNDIGRGGDFADVEFDLTNHSTERRDLWNHLNEIRSNTFDRNLAIQKRSRVRQARNCDVQFDVIGQGYSLVLTRRTTA